MRSLLLIEDEQITLFYLLTLLKSLLMSDSDAVIFGSLVGNFFCVQISMTRLADDEPVLWVT